MKNIRVISFLLSAAFLLPATAARSTGAEELTPPFSATYKKNGKTLCYISSFHQTSAESETFKLIKNRFELFNPQVVVVEGFQAEAGLSPQELVDYVRKHEKDKNLEESVYAASLAINAGAEFTGGEPSTGDTTGRLDASRFTMRDLFGFLVVRQIPVWKRLGKTGSFNRLFSDFSKNTELAYKFDGSALMTPEEFKDWYKRVNKKDFDFGAVTPGEAGPVPDGRLFTQKMGVEIDRIREAVIAKTIKDMLGRFDRVLVVYGSQHYINERQMLESMLGSPDFFRLSAQ